jgi:hypothetical protein
MSTKLAGFLLLLLTFGSVQVNADQVYEVIGTLTIPGNRSNPGVGETINYAFELDYYTAQNGNQVSAIVGTPTITSDGPLGTFYMNTGGFGQADGYVAFFSGPQVSGFTSAEIDLGGYFTPTFAPEPIPVQGNGSDLWACFAPLPCSEFAPPGTNYPNGGSDGLLWGGTSSSAVYLVSTPEPGTLCLLVAGALALGVLKKFVL